jgi:hypothetical protein
VSESDRPSPLLKLDRSREHLDALWVEYKNVMPTQRARLRKAVEGLWEVTRYLGGMEFPPRWGLIAGDAIHNARSALDHLVCHRVRANGRKVTRKHQFPIYDREPDQRGRESIAENLKGLPGTERDLILDLQPWRDPTSQRSQNLVLLALLDNLDKHQLTQPVLTVLAEGEGRGSQGSYDPNVKFNVGVALVPGAEIVRWPIGLQLPALNLSATFGLGFGEIEATQTRIEEMRVEVIRIIESFPGFRPAT